MRITVGWYIGVDDWAFKNLAKHIISELPEFDHVFNEPSNVNILFDPNQFRYFDPDFSTMLRLDGNRWYENPKPYIRL